MAFQPSAAPWRKPSIGSVVPPGTDYLKRIRHLCDHVHAPCYTEHLAVTRAAGRRLDNLSPLWLTDDTLATTIDNVRRVQDALERSLVLENIAEIVNLPAPAMSPAEFFSALHEPPAAEFSSIWQTCTPTR